MNKAQFDKEVAELTIAAEAYYQKIDKSSMTDIEYDIRERNIRDIANEHPEYISEEYENLTGRVAAGTTPRSSKLPKVRHSSPMMSIDKAKKEDRKKIEQFLKNTAEFGAEEKGWEAELKLDGNAVAALYSGGKLVSLATRGNGEEGDEILVLAKSPKTHIEGLPLETDITQKFEVRGELLMTSEQFLKTDNSYYEFQKAQNDRYIKINAFRRLNPMANGKPYRQFLTEKTEGELHFANQRNAIGGIISSISENGEFSIEYVAQMTFYTHGILASDLSYEELKINGFIGVKELDKQTFTDGTICHNIQDIYALIEKWETLGVLDEDAVRTINGVPTDGIVIKCVENERISGQMGSTAHHPKSMIAIKMQGSSAVGVVDDIIINVGRTGRITLTAMLRDAVKIDGSNVQFATLHNPDWLQKKDVRIGSTVEVVKRNDIIPYIEAVLSQSPGTLPYKVPDICPIKECSTPLDKRTLLWRCPNESCPSRLVPALKQAVSRNYLDIDELSIETLEALDKADLIHDLADIFSLTVENLAKLPLPREYTVDGISADGVTYKKGDRMLLGTVTALKIVDAIDRAKKLGLARILASLNIPTLGIQLAKNLARVYPSITELQNASVEDLKGVELISDRKAEIIAENLLGKRELIAKLQAAGVDLTSHIYSALEENLPSNLPLQGEIVVISGNIPGYNREQAKELIETLGAKTSSSVSTKTTLLIADPESKSSKVTKATDLGVKIIHPDKFLQTYQIS